MPDKAEIRNVAQGVIVERLGPEAEIVNVTVDEGTDAWGEGILYVRVVFDSPTGRLDPKRTVGLIRLLRPRLSEISEERFPVLSFISREDWDAEAA